MAPTCAQQSSAQPHFAAKSRHSVGPVRHAAPFAALTLLAAALLAATGYVQQTTDVNVAQPPEAIAAVRFLSGPLPAAILAAGIVLCAFYPLTRERHARLLKAIEKKRALREQFAKE